MQNRIGNITIVSLILLMAGLPVLAQISPGKLSESHAHLEGLSNCTKCHLLGEKVSSEKCLDCHREIAVRIKDRKGYHSSSEVRANDCIKCHSDHHGRNFQMIHLDTDGFRHAATGYDLKGTHANNTIMKVYITPESRPENFNNFSKNTLSMIRKNP